VVEQQNLGLGSTRIQHAKDKLAVLMPTLQRPFNIRTLAIYTGQWRADRDMITLKALMALKAEGVVKRIEWRGWQWVYSAAEQKARREMEELNG
jgi:hypothetical protein